MSVLAQAEAPSGKRKPRRQWSSPLPGELAAARMPTRGVPKRVQSRPLFRWVQWGMDLEVCPRRLNASASWSAAHLPPHRETRGRGGRDTPPGLPSRAISVFTTGLTCLNEREWNHLGPSLSRQSASCSFVSLCRSVLPCSSTQDLQKAPEGLSGQKTGLCRLWLPR